MANYSDLTRREQVLARLKAADGGWVDGSELATEEIGGSEGLRRLRELADEGHNIRKRRHPDAQRDIWQYKLVPQSLSLEADAREVLAEISRQVAEKAPAVYDVVKASEGEGGWRKPAPQSPWPADHQQAPISSAVRRKEDGTYEYVPPQRPLQEAEQLTALEEPDQPEGTKFESLPKHVDWGSVAVCPRCKSKTTRGRDPKPVDLSALTPKERRARERKAKDAPRLVDEDGVKLFKDPTAKPTQPCRRCNGYGIVPNVGPIPFTPPAPPDEKKVVEAPTTEAFPDG